MSLAIFIFMLVFVLIVALILGFLLAPVLMVGYILILDAIAHKIAYTKHNKINGSYADIKKPNDVKDSLNFRPLKGERSKPTQKCNVTYFYDCCQHYLNSRGLPMTTKPIEKCIFYPILKTHICLVGVYHRLKRTIN